MIGQLWRQWEEPESQAGQVGQASSLCSSRAHTSRGRKGMLAGGMLGVCTGRSGVLGRGNRPPGQADCTGKAGGCCSRERQPSSRLVGQAWGGTARSVGHGLLPSYVGNLYYN